MLASVKFAPQKKRFSEGDLVGLDEGLSVGSLIGAPVVGLADGAIVIFEKSITMAVGGIVGDTIGGGACSHAMLAKHVYSAPSAFWQISFPRGSWHFKAVAQLASASKKVLPQ